MSDQDVLIEEVAKAIQPAVVSPRGVSWDQIGESMQEMCREWARTVTAPVVAAFEITENELARRDRLMQQAIIENERLRANCETLADKWQRNEERSADYQDALADAAEQLRAVLEEKDG